MNEHVLDESKEQLLSDCQTLHSCSQISKKYKVSDKTIKK